MQTQYSDNTATIRSNGHWKLPKKLQPGFRFSDQARSVSGPGGRLTPMLFLETIKSRPRKVVLIAIFLVVILRTLLEMRLLEPKLIENYLPETIVRMSAEGTCRNLAIPVEKLQIPTKPQPMIAPALFLHVGKAGGGSVEHRAAMNWNIALCRCHPDPCPRLVDGSSHYLINIRDPIDRFVSIFNWRMIVLCHPEGDSRTPVANGAFADTDHLCEMELPFNRDEIQALFYTYQADVNRLAESLCPATAASLDAEPDLALIRHTPTLRDWLGSHWLDFQPKIFPIVQEKGTDFDRQVDDALYWLHNETRFESDEDFQLRAHEALRFENELIMMEKDSSGHKHSSGVHPNLTKDAEICLAMLFEDDYRLIETMLKKGVCKSDECFSGLSSILERRSSLWNKMPWEVPPPKSLFAALSSLVGLLFG